MASALLFRKCEGQVAGLVLAWRVGALSAHDSPMADTVDPTRSRSVPTGRRSVPPRSATAFGRQHPAQHGTGGDVMPRSTDSRATIQVAWWAIRREIH